MNKPYVKVSVGDINNINARYYAALSTSEGPKKIMKDHKSDDVEWAKKVYEACVAAVKDADTPKLKEKKTAS